MTEKPLTFNEFEVLRAVPNGRIVMWAHTPGAWFLTSPSDPRGHPGQRVSDTMRRLLERKYAIADGTFTDGQRKAKVTQTGYVVLSYSTRHKPNKKR